MRDHHLLLYIYQSDVLYLLFILLLQFCDITDSIGIQLHKLHYVLLLSRIFCLIKALVWCGVRGQLPLCTTYYGIIVRDEIWVGEHKWGSKKKRQSTIHWWTFFVFPSGTTAMAYKKLIQNALLEALHATIVLHILHKGLFLVMPNPPPFLFPSICHIA